jgi:hypothetical protein
VLQRHFACVVLLMLGGATTSAAQTGSAALTGVIHDATAQPVAGAAVVVTAVATGTARTTTTKSDGRYSVVALLPGSYQVAVTGTGFRPLVRTGVVLETGETIRLDLKLEVGSSETVTVSGDAPLLQSERGSLGQVVDRARIESLPLNGRTFVTLATLAPGVALPPGTILPRINGGRPRTNEYLYDGISVLQPEPGQVAFIPIIDSIQEFRIERNSPPAEFGRFNGGVVNLTMRSGTNRLSGAAFEFFRDQSLNARNYFQRSDPSKPTLSRNQFGGVLGGPIRTGQTFFFADYQGQRQEIARTVTSTVPTLLQRQGIFTEAISGRVPTIYDPQTTVVNANGTVTRTPFANNTVPMDRWDPVARTLLARYPEPTSSGTANNFSRTAGEIDDQDQGDVRIDHRFRNGQDSAFGRLSSAHGAFTPVTPLPDGSGTTTGTLGPQDTRAWSFASNYVHVFSDRWLNELRIGDTRRSVKRSATSVDGSLEDAIGLPGIPSAAQFPSTLPTFSIAGYQPLGSPANTASSFRTQVTQIADSLSWVGGRHSVKMGIDFRWERLNVIQPPSPTGAFSFSTLFTDLNAATGTGASLASFMLGQVQSFSIDLQQNQIRNRADIQEYFVQDDWHLTSNTTVNAGVRYTLNFPSTEVDDQAAVFNLDARQLEYLGRDGNPRSARRLHMHDFGPRLGLVHQVNHRLVARGGFGVVFIEQAGITTPFTTPAFPFLQTVSQRTLDNIVPAFVLAGGPTVVPVGLTPNAGLGQGVFAVEAARGSGSVRQWNVSTEFAQNTNTTVEVAYAGSHITNVGVPDANINQLTVDQLAQGPTLTQRVSNPYFGIIPRSSSLGDPTITRAQLMKPFPDYTAVSLYRNNLGTTDYWGVTLKLERRWSRGLTFLVSYTRSHLEDDASSVFDASILTGPILNAPVADAFNRSLDRDVSSGDIPHVFVTSAVWEVPVGCGHRYRPGGILGAVVNDWSVSSIVTLQSGLPVAVTQVTNFNAFAGFGTQRPNLVGDPELPSDERTTAHWFNTAAFAIAPQFTLGSASRNPVRGPSYRNVDLSVARRIPAGGANVEIRLDTFNLLNTTPFGQPNGVAGTPAFGTITTAGDPRVVQVAVKLSW